MEPSAKKMADKLEITSGNLEKIIKDGVSKKEAIALLEKINEIKIPLPDSIKILKKKLESINGESETLTDDTQLGIDELKKRLESKESESSNSFEGLREELGSKNEILDKLFGISHKYFEQKLNSIGEDGPEEYRIQKSEKENIKLVLWDKLIQNLRFDLAMGTITTGIKGKVQELFNVFKSSNKQEKDTKKENNIEKVLKGLTKIETDLNGEGKKDNSEISKLFLGIDTLMGDSFTKLENAKKEEKKLNTVQEISSIIEGKPSNKTFDDIKDGTLNKLKDIENVQSKTNSIKSFLESLPKEWQKNIKEFIKGIAKEYPILGFIIALFLGKGFLEGNEGGTKTKKSLNSLVLLIQNTKEADNSIKKLNIEELTKLDPKKLEDFFSYLDKNEIDYTTDTFWKELLAGGSKNDNINRLNQILKSDGNIIGTDGKNITTNFIKKLNNINELEEKLIKTETETTIKENEAVIATSVQLNQKAETRNTEVSQLETKVVQLETKTEKTETEKIEEARVKEELQEKKDLQKKEEADRKVAEEKATKAKEENEKIALEKQFEESITGITSLPAEIIYKGKSIPIDIENNKTIILGENKDKYNISIKSSIGNAFESIKFDSGEIQITHIDGLFSSATKAIKKQELIEVILALIENKEYSKKYIKENATLNINKIA